MKHVFTILSVLLFYAATVMISGCSRTDEPEPVVMTAVSFAEDRVIESMYTRKPLDIRINPSDAEFGSIRWTSSDESVVFLLNETRMPDNRTTRMTAVPLGLGSADVTVEVDGKKTTCKVLVADAYLNVKTLDLLVSEEYDLIAKTIPDGLLDSVYNWTSSAPDIVSVNDKGNVRALSNGNATVQCMFIGKPLTVNITVSSTVFALESIYATPSTGEISCTMKTSEDVSEKGVCWCIEDREPTVDDNVVNAGTGNGDYVAVITGLTALKSYHIRPYYRIGDKVFYAEHTKFRTPNENWRYDDEYGVTWYGVYLGGSVWAPMPCGYKAPDENGKGYPYGKLYQMGRPAGQGRGEAVWNDPSDHKKGGYFIDENGMKVTLVYGQCEPNKLGEADKFYFNDTPYMFTDYDVDGTEEEVATVWKMYDRNHRRMDFNWFIPEFGDKMDRNPCPKGWSVQCSQWFVEAFTKVKNFRKDDGKIVWYENGYPYQGVVFDLSVGGYRGADGEIHTVPKDVSYPLVYNDDMYFNPYLTIGDNVEYRSHYQVSPDGFWLFKTFNNATAASVRCSRYEGDITE